MIKTAQSLAEKINYRPYVVREGRAFPNALFAALDRMSLKRRRSRNTHPGKRYR